ncbi:hypothetical protein [Micromonospora inositola]|uniref:hypothetical protein n=1 Tax=Micromonospora inositola TaxID=47865 RepID=UPI0015605747|nr:hypothetical protein [Micromonospora inositola]
MSTERFPALLDGPGNHVRDPREQLLGYLDWYRRALARKTPGLSGSVRRRRRPASAGSSSTRARSTPGTSVSSTWPAKPLDGRTGE